MAFTHLHVHSHYSLLDGLPKIDDLIERAKALGMKSLALTDHGNMYGLIEFYQKAKKAGIKPILGVEAYVARRTRFDKEAGEDTKPYHLILLAENFTGYKNLIKLITRAQLEGFYYRPRVDWDLLSIHHEGLIASSACLNGEISQTFLNFGEERAIEVIEKFKTTFGKNNFFLEVQPLDATEQRQLNEFLIRIGKKLHIPVIATNDVHYIHQEDAEAQDILLCIQTKHKQSDTERMTLMGQNLSMKSEEEMQKAFPENPEVCDATEALASRCSVELSFGTPLLPHFPLPKGVTADQRLEELCYAGIPRIYPDVAMKQQVEDRLRFELQTIKQTGFASYFLIVHDFVSWAKNNGIVVGPGRGSAAGSIASYLLNITSVDPIRYELLFERFLNPERISMPDIDLDFADTRRDEVIRYVEERYGKDHVAQIITFGTMAARAAVRDVGRVLGLPYSYCDRIAKLIPMFTTLTDAINTVPELKEVMQAPEGKKLLEMAQKLEGVARHSSTHACGVVITKDPLEEYVPTQYASTSDQTIISQYSLHPIEDLGLLKMDFLGLKNLTVIEQALEIIKKARGLDLKIESIPLDDTATFELLQKGQTVGVFQLESSGMRRYLKELKPTSLEDIIAMVSLYRPGPIEFIPDFIAGKHGRKKIRYIHPQLEHILNKTYGIVVYQEQVMQIARDLAGFTFGQADVLRKAVGKKIKSLLDEQRDKLIVGMVEHGIEKETAIAIWKFIEPFARYGFNRAHAACYAIIAYQTAYLKTHYPDEFMAALMTGDQHNMDRIAIEIEEARQMNITVLPPDINESYSTFTAVFDHDKKESTHKIRFGLLAIKNVGENIVKAIVQERKNKGQYASLEDFLIRVQSKDLNKKSLESLTESGALDHFAERNQILANMENMIKFVRTQADERTSKQTNLFGGLGGTQHKPKITFLSAEPATQKQRLAWEKELLGMYITEHPITRLIKKLQKHTSPIANILQDKELGSRRIEIVCVVAQTKRILTKAMDPMLFVKCEDQTASIEVIVFPKTLQAYPTLWQEGNILIVKGKKSDKNGEDKLIADYAELVPDMFDEVVIDIPKGMDEKQFAQIQELLKNSPGGLSVRFTVERQTGKTTIATPYKIQLSPELKTKLAELVGSEHIHID
jgi:DNA polymerase-3 subunit alpha